METQKTFYLIPVFMITLATLLGVLYAGYKYYLPGETELFMYNILFILFVCLVFSGKRVSFDFSNKVLETTNFFIFKKETKFQEIKCVKEYSDKGQLRPRTMILDKSGQKIIDISDYEFGLKLAKNKSDLVTVVQDISNENSKTD